LIVVDASALLEVLLQTPAAEAVARRLFAAGEALHAPHLIDVEIVHVLRRYALAGELDDERGLSALDDLEALPLERYPHGFLLARAWEVRDNVTAYDAIYIAFEEKGSE
jgi:predicted nucleic acid-binding protein